MQPTDGLAEKRCGRQECRSSRAKGSLEPKRRYGIGDNDTVNSRIG